MACLQVGQGFQFRSVRDAVAAAAPHDTVVVHGHVEEADCVHVRMPLTLAGKGPDAVLSVSGLLGNGKGLLCTHADVVVRNLELRRGRALSGNAAGIWHEGKNMVVEGCRFVENQNGIMLAGDLDGVVRIRRCSFVRNGAGCGHTHGIYASRVGELGIEECSFENTAVGHHVKSRAGVLRVERSHFAGGAGCTASYAIDVANGGVAVIRNNQLIKGRGAMHRVFICYAAEGLRHRRNAVEVSSNIFINHRRGPVAAVVNRAGSVPAVLHGNAYERVAFGLLGRGRQTTRRPAQATIAAGIL